MFLNFIFIFMNSWYNHNHSEIHNFLLLSVSLGVWSRSASRTSCSSWWSWSSTWEFSSHEVWGHTKWFIKRVRSCSSTTSMCSVLHSNYMYMIIFQFHFSIWVIMHCELLTWLIYPTSQQVGQYRWKVVMVSVYPLLIPAHRECEILMQSLRYL